ncbi:MAG: PilZ domain-containing protein [Sphingomonas sp.]
MLASSTIFSLNADLPTALPAPAEGHESSLDSAVLAGDHERSPCLIRRFTAAGATLRLPTTDLAEGDLRILELKNGQTIPGTIGWLAEDEVGFMFDAPMDVVGTLARNLAILPAERRHVPRVEIHQTVCLHRGNNVEFSRTRDISQAGVGIQTNLALQEGDVVQLAFDGLRPLTGKVRWERDGFAGIAFDEELGWQTLMPWLRDVQNRPQRPAGTRTHGFHDEDRGFGITADKNAILLNAPGRVREGTIWWNVQVRSLTATLVEFEAAADIAKGTQLWISIPGSTGWPISVIEAEAHRYLAEFRLPLRQHELALIAPGRLQAS